MNYFHFCWWKHELFLALCELWDFLNHLLSVASVPNFSHRDQNSTWLWGTSALPPPPVLSAALPNLAILASPNMITPRLIKTAVFFVPASLFYGVETASWQYVQADVGFASLVLLFSGIKFCAACCPGSENNWLIYSVSFLAVTPSWLESMINVFSVPKSATILTV